MTDEQEVTTVVYPRFLGVDESGEMVWELADGRWTWADDPYMAVRRLRTFEPARYLEKYGPVKVPDLFLARVVPAPETMVSVAGVKAARAEAFEDGKRRGAEVALSDIMTARLNGCVKALTAMAQAAKGWAEGSAENEEAMGRRDRKPAEEQEFRLADILNMINDAAREVGVAPEYGSVK